MYQRLAAALPLLAVSLHTTSDMIKSVEGVDARLCLVGNRLSV